MTKKYLTYEEARQWACDNNITTCKQWKDALRPDHIPLNVDKIYQSEFQANGRWIGFLKSPHGRYNQKNFVSIEEASQWAQDNGITTKEQWGELSHIRPSNIPSNPLYTYKEQFSQIGGWRGFLKTTSLRNTSHVERLVALVLDSVLSPKSDIHSRHKITGASGKKHSVDMAYSDIKLIMEYDGEYYHRNKMDSDCEKTADLKSAGWNVVRIRETPLEILDKQWNVAVPQNKKFKLRVERVLLHILKLDAQGSLTLGAYRSQLQNALEHLDISAYVSQLMQYKNFVPYAQASQWAKDNNITTQRQWFAAAEQRPSYIPGDPYDFYKEEFNELGGWGGFLQTNRIANQNLRKKSL